MSDKQAGQTQVAWALLTEGVSQARLEAHRLRHTMNRVQTMVDKSPAKEHLYERAGDIIMALPRRLEALETALDRTSYALSVLGAEHLRERLPMADRALVDDAAHKGAPFGRSAARVAERYLRRGH